MNQSFFKDLPKDLIDNPDTSADVIFHALNDISIDPTAARTRNNYIKSTFKFIGFKKEINLDNTTLSTFFCETENVTTKSVNYEEDDEKLTEIRFIIHNLLPDFERDIMSLIFDYNKIQEDIGVILGLSQEMVNYYKKRAIHRIRHFFDNRKIDVNDMRSCLSRYVSKKQLEAMMLYFLKHNQRIVSKELGISQSAVSARLKQGLKKIKRRTKNDERAAKYYDVFDNLTKQKSLYNSQTRMKVITNVDNYAQFDSDNQRIEAQKPVKIKKKKIIKKKVKSTRIKHFKIEPTKVKQVSSKRIKFDRSKFKLLRQFFKKR